MKYSTQYKVRTAQVTTCNTDTILDSGATQILFPLNHPNLTKVNSYKSSAVMAVQITKLQLCGEAEYGIFNVLISDIQHPLISEGVITGLIWYVLYI